MDNLKKIVKKEEEILPLLSAEQARRIATSGTKEQEMQEVADLIRARVEAHKFTLEVIELNYATYVYETLVNAKYEVRFISTTALHIKWLTKIE
jgi:MarR-like DNA-binding transcriptional regulator SgrR of sgrS sRNA